MHLRGVSGVQDIKCEGRKRERNFWDILHKNRMHESTFQISTAPILTSLMGADVRTRTCQKLQGRTKYKVLKWVNRRLWGSCKCTNKPLVHVHVQTIHDAVEGKGKGEEVLRQ